MATFNDARAIALALPETTDGTSYGTPSLRVRGKFFARLWEDGETLVLKCDPAEREVLIASAPEVCFVTPHYEDYPYILIRLPGISRTELAVMIEEGWALAAPKRLLAAFVAARDGSDPV